MTPSQIRWTPRFQEDVARIEREPALQLLIDISKFAKTGIGDVEKLVDDPGQRWRLRSGNYRALFVLRGDNSLVFLSAEHRKDAYR